MPTPLSATQNCITEAARFVLSNAGAAERLLAVHHPRAHGRCAGCGGTLIRWPCVIVAIARCAQELRAGDLAGDRSRTRAGVRPGPTPL